MSWGILGASWCLLCRLEGVLGRLGSVLGRLGSVLAASWGVLAASWAVLGASWRVLGASCGVLLRLGGVLGASWTVLKRKTTSKKPGLAMNGKRVFIHLRLHFSDICCFFFQHWPTVRNFGTSVQLYAPLASRAARARSLRLYNGYLFYSCAVANCTIVMFF